MADTATLLKVHRKIVDYYVQYVLCSYWRRRGLTVGADILWLGVPIITLVSNSRISIGQGSLLCSRCEQTALGVNHPIILRTIRSGAKMEIGAGVRISGATICSAKRVNIGNRCVLGSNVQIADTDFHAMDATLRSSRDDAVNANAEGVSIGDDVFIGSGVIVLKGVEIGARSVIGAGSVVSRSIRPGSVAAGNPAREIREL